MRAIVRAPGAHGLPGTFRPMRLRAADGSELWLGYGMNVHPGGCARTTRLAIESTVLPLRDRLGVRGPFGLAVRWSAAGVRRLRDDACERDALRDLLTRHHLRVFTGNAFVYGEFHGAPLKDAVYRPPWSDPRRVEYTRDFAAVLMGLAEPGTHLSLSTLPCSWKGWGGDGSEVVAAARGLAAFVRSLPELEDRTGVRLRLGIEPEPGCTLETTEETLAFFRGPLAQALGREESWRERVGVCFDVCHQAVAWEDVEASLAAFAAHGVRVVKLQASCALELPDPTDPAGRASLAAFDEPVYLHQVAARDAQGVHRAPDLGPVLADPAWRGRGAWRSHFHVPVFRARATGPLRTTQAELARALRVAGGGGLTSHVEIETYTWDVLPSAERDAGSGFDLVEALAREYEWVLGVLAEAGARPWDARSEP